MSDDSKKTTIAVDFATAEIADAIAEQLTRLNGFKVSRSAVARRAIRDLYLIVCPSDRTDRLPKDEQIAA